MDTNNWKPTQVGEPSMDTGDWRSQLQADSRQRIVNKIMDTFKRLLPFSGQEELQELKKIAARFEEKIYTAAIRQSDYVRKISLKMLIVEMNIPMHHALLSNSANTGQNSPDPACQSIQSQMNSQGPPLPILVQSYQSQAGQQLLPQNILNNMASAGVQGSASLTSSLPLVSSLSQTTMPNVVTQNSDLQNIGVSQDSVTNAIGQGVPSNMFANSQRQIQQGSQQQGVPQWQQQQSQNSQQYLYQQHLLMKQKLQQQGNISNSQMQSDIQQQQQQHNLLQPNQLHSSQQSVLQPSMMQSSPLYNLQQNQQSSVRQSTQSVHQQHPPSVLRQQQPQSIHQQQTPLQQQAILPTQQQQHQQQRLVEQQSNATNMQQTLLIGQQNSIPDMQQQQQRLLSQQNNLSNRQQQRQLMGLQNNLPNMHQLRLGPQSSVGGLQQHQHHQLLGTQSGSSIMPNNQNSVHILQQSKVPLQQPEQTMSNLLPSQGQQSQQQSQQHMSNLLPSQGQLSQQQMMSRIQPQQGQLQQQIGLQQQPNSFQCDMQQRLQTPGSLLQKNLIDKNQLFQPQTAIPEASSTTPTNPYKGVRKRKSKWVAENLDPIKKRRLWLSTYAAEKKRRGNKTMIVSSDHESLSEENETPITEPVINVFELESELYSDEETETPITKFVINVSDPESSSEETKTPLTVPVCNQESDQEVLVNENGFETIHSGDQSLEDVNEQEHEDEVLLMQQQILSGDIDIGDFLAKFGHVIVDKNGCILGEYNWMEDLSLRY